SPARRLRRRAGSTSPNGRRSSRGGRFAVAVPPAGDDSGSARGGVARFSRRRRLLSAGAALRGRRGGFARVVEPQAFSRRAGARRRSRRRCLAQRGTGRKRKSRRGPARGPSRPNRRHAHRTAFLRAPAVMGILSAPRPAAGGFFTRDRPRRDRHRGGARSAGGAGKILLISDGNQTRGELARALPLLRSRGIAVSVLPVSLAGGKNEVYV